MRFNKSDLKTTLLYPIKAIISREFYFKVLFSMKGLGILYLFLLSTVFAIPAAYRSADVMDFFKALELPRLIAQLPPSYLDQNGVLSTSSQEDSYKLIKNSQGKPAIVFNTTDKPLSGEAVDAPVEFNSTFIKVHTEKGDANIEYRGVFETGTDFSPTYMAQAVDQVINATPRMLWAVMFLWFFVLLCLNTLISACLGRFLMLFVFRIRIGFGTALRLCAFANTAVAVIILAQFYVYLPVSYTIMVIIPLLYVAWFSQGFRKELTSLGLDAFKAKYSSNTYYYGNSSAYQNTNNPSANTSFKQGAGGDSQNYAEQKEQSGTTSKDEAMHGNITPENPLQASSAQQSEQNEASNTVTNENSDQNKEQHRDQHKDQNNDDDRRNGPGCFEA